MSITFLVVFLHVCLAIGMCLSACVCVYMRVFRTLTVHSHVAVGKLNFNVVMSLDLFLLNWCNQMLIYEELYLVFFIKLLYHNLKVVVNGLFQYVYCLMPAGTVNT